MEQIRITKEMRDACARANQPIRPRFHVWENVHGAFSSNKGEDFRAVLEEIARIADENAAVPRPADGRWTNAGCIMGDGWSIAWRVHDAQFWGVPQRRRRIAVVADFGGESAPEILFVRQSLCGSAAPGRKAGQGVAADAQMGADAADRDHEVAKCLKSKANMSYREDSDTLVMQPACFKYKQGEQARGIAYSEDAAPTLDADGGHPPAAICLQGNCIDRADTAGCNGKGWSEDAAYTLNTIDRHAVAYSFDSLSSNSMKSANPHSGCRETEIAKTIDTTVPDPSKNQGGIAILNVLPFDATQITSPQNRSNPQFGDVCPTLHAGFDMPAVAIDCRNFAASEVSATLQAKENGGQSLNYINPVLTYQEITGALAPGRHPGSDNRQDATNDRLTAASLIVRRLTPLECERLQGYPDGWTLLGEISDMPEDTYVFWCETLLQKAQREQTARKNEGGVLEVWRYVTCEHKTFDKTREVDEGGGYWENTRKTYRHKTRPQMVRWYNKSFCADADSARYKALGNSIALPFWKWLIKRISALYERDATMCSLFDGIGGFAYLWERVNGKGSCLWTSEIELFPIAVTRARLNGG